MNTLHPHTAIPTPTPTDRALAERWQRGDQQAAKLLVVRHRGSLQRYFRVRVKEPDCEDLLQETLSKITRAVHNFEFRSSFRAYLFRIADYTLKDYLRKLYRRPVMEELDGSKTYDEPEPEQQMLDAEQLCLVLESTDTLSPVARDLVDRYYFQSITTSRIAAEDGIPDGTVRRRLYDARKVMRRHIERPDAGRDFTRADDQALALLRSA